MWVCESLGSGSPKPNPKFAVRYHALPVGPVTSLCPSLPLCDRGVTMVSPSRSLQGFREEIVPKPLTRGPAPTGCWVLILIISGVRAASQTWTRPSASTSFWELSDPFPVMEPTLSQPPRPSFPTRQRPSGATEDRSAFSRLRWILWVHMKAMTPRSIHLRSQIPARQDF